MFDNIKKYGKEIECPKCGSKMIIDDIDYNFKGCQDEYWKCDNCKSASAFVKVRYSKVCKITYDMGE